MPKTIAVDFDGVLHHDPRGYDDIHIDGQLLSGAEKAIRKLQERYAVAVVTCRDVGTAACWLYQQTGIPTHADIAMEYKFWQNQNVLLVTNRKVVASAYIDDRAIRFTYWERILAELNDHLARTGPS